MLSDILENSKLRPECANNYMMPHLDRIITLFRKLEKEAGNDYFYAFKRKELPKGEYLLREGMVSQYLWFLEQGIARLFTHQEGVEVIGDFFFSCEFVDSYKSSAIKIPSAVNIQLISNSIVYSASWDQLEKLKLKYPVLAEIEKLIVACNISWLEEWLYNARFFTAQERYIYLLNRQPHLIQKIPLTYVASYLGISLETLSRIRAKLNKVTIGDFKKKWSDYQK
jgi:CRP-like cAMP-binding protein